MSCAGAILAAVCALAAPDKVGHYAGGATIVAASAIAIPSQYAPEIGLSLTAAAAIGKELYDRRHPETHTADRYDAAATLLGGALVYAALKTDRWRIGATAGGAPQVKYLARF